MLPFLADLSWESTHPCRTCGARALGRYLVLLTMPTAVELLECMGVGGWWWPSSSRAAQIRRRVWMAPLRQMGDSVGDVSSGC
eukprot:549884-Ditylum_brightwellii.AAC.2